MPKTFLHRFGFGTITNIQCCLTLKLGPLQQDLTSEAELFKSQFSQRSLWKAQLTEQPARCVLQCRSAAGTGWHGVARGGTGWHRLPAPRRCPGLQPQHGPHRGHSPGGSAATAAAEPVPWTGDPDSAPACPSTGHWHTAGSTELPMEPGA